jgi:uncharacterized OB-fold protein
MQPMGDFANSVAPMVYHSRISVPYSWWAGETASRFFATLRDECKIIGLRCNDCGKTYVPPRKTCPTCFTPNSQWIEVADTGTVISHTVVRRQLAALPKPVPVIFGLVKLDGADTALLHYLEEIDPAVLRIGLRVKACFAEERTGSINDIACFRPEPS